MAATLTPKIVCITTTAKSGQDLNMLLMRLPSGGLLVHSPTFGEDDTFENVRAIGEPEILFAPNNFHHLSLKRFRDQFPNAIAVAGVGAIPRLLRQGHEGVRPVADVADRLPEGAHWLECEGTKSGETWLSLAGSAEQGRSWIVCDAFYNLAPKALRGLFGLAARVLKIGPDLCISSTFPWLALSDVPVYRAWALETIAVERPQRLFFSHGEPLTADDVSERLAAKIHERL